MLPPCLLWTFKIRPESSSLITVIYVPYCLEHLSQHRRLLAWKVVLYIHPERRAGGAEQMLVRKLSSICSVNIICTFSGFCFVKLILVRLVFWRIITTMVSFPSNALNMWLSLWLRARLSSTASRCCIELYSRLQLCCPYLIKTYEGLHTPLSCICSCDGQVWKSSSFWVLHSPMWNL